MKKIILLLVLFVGLFSGCSDDESVTNVYSFRMMEYNSNNFMDIATIKDYLEEKGCIMKHTLSGKDNADTDAQAKALFDAAVAKISTAELDALDLSPQTSFWYGVSRAANGEVVDIGKYRYP